MEKQHIANFDLICRTCLSVEPNLKSIFNSDFANMLNDCQLLKVSLNDGYPSQICSHCQDLVHQCFSFKQLCEKSNNTLQKYTVIEDNNICTTEVVKQESKAIWEISTEIPEKLDRFPCDCCSEIFNTKTDLLLHQNSQTKNENKAFVCTHCNRKFTSSQYLKRHIKVHLIKEATCKNCGEYLPDNTNLDKHLCKLEEQSSTPDNIGSCTKFRIPGINLNSKKSEEEYSNLTSFLEEESRPTLPFPCSMCPQSFQAECDLDLHICIHNNLKTDEYACTECKKKFATRRILKRHIKTHMMYKPHRCRECDKGFAESHALTKHMRKHTGEPREKKHLCSVCGQGFSEPFYLNVHFRKHTGERPLMCSACGKSFADPRSLKAHNMTHTGEKPYECHICSKAFSQSVNLTKHMRVHTGEKPYVCAQCGKCFSQSSSLDKHTRIHSGIRPYACEKCPKRFTEKKTLVDHQRTHTGEKPYICAQCGQSFSSSSELKLHDRKHSGIKKNICNICGKDFATANNLVIHTRSHSGEKPFPCEICGRPFADKGTLKKHKNIHIQKYADANINYVVSEEANVNLNHPMDSFQNIDSKTEIGISDIVYINLP